MESVNKEEIIQLAKEFGKFIAETKDKYPYQINLVETIGVDE